MNAIAAATNTAPLPHLWACARALLTEMIKLFGAPSALTAHARLAPTLRRALLPWVRSLEELVRKLLLAEAAAQIPCAAPLPWRSAPALYPFKRAHHAPESAVATRPHARFNLTIPRDEHIVADNHAPRIRALWGESRAPAGPVARAPQRAGIDRLALHFEALRCVIEKPAPYVRRLAARLARIARDQRPRAALRFACRGPDRIAPGFGEPLRSARTLVFAHAEKLGEPANKRRPSTSSG